MRTDWYQGVNPNLDRLTELLSMSKPSHGYTIAEKGSEIVTAPGVYFPAQKGEVIPLKPRQDGGEVTPSKSLPEDKETAKLEMLMSIISKVNPSNLETKAMMGLNFPPESMSIEKTKYDILKSAISVLKPPKQPSEGKSSAKPSSSKTEGGIPLESREMGGEVDPADLSLLQSILMRSTKKRLPFNERTSGYGSPPGKSMFSNIPGLPKPPTAQSYGIQPDALKVGTADKGMSEGDLLWAKKQTEDWGPGASRIVGGKRVDWEEGMDTPFFSRKDGGTTTPVFGESEGISEEERLRLMAAMKPSPANVINMNPNATGTFEVAPEVDPYSRVDIPQVSKPFYTGPEGTMTVAPETPESIRGDELARTQLTAGIKKQESERELLAKSKGYGRDLGYWAAHPEEKAQYDLEQMLSRYPQKERVEFIKNLGKPDTKVPSPISVGGEGVFDPSRGLFFKAPWEKAKTEKSPTELGLIAKARELKSDGTLTDAAIEAQGQLDDLQKRKVDLAGAQLDVKSKDIDIQALADGIGEGQDARIAIKGSMGNPVASKAQSLVYKKYPKFDFNMSDANYKWKQSQINQRTINFVGGSLPRVEALANQLQALPNADIPAINAVMRQISIQTGRPEYTNFESNRNAIVQEINTALSGSATGSDMRIKIELENLNAARSPQQIIGSINNLREALLARLDVDLSPIYPIEVVQGKKTLEEYKSELYKRYRGKYGGEPGIVGIQKVWKKKPDGTWIQE